MSAPAPARHREVWSYVDVRCPLCGALWHRQAAGVAVSLPLERRCRCRRTVRFTTTPAGAVVVQSTR